MQALVRKIRPLALLLIVALIGADLPTRPAFATMVTSERAQEARKARDHIEMLLQRGELRAQLQARGISPAEAKARIDSLTDDEVIALATTLNKLPAGGDPLGIVVVAVIIAAIIVLIGRISARMRGAP